jgi:signal transduction histidine kinase
VMGVAAFATAEPGRTYGAEDRRLAEELGRRAALAIDNAQLYQQAQEAIRLRDMVLSSVTHDLRNPLGAIKMIVEAVKWQVSQLPPPDPAPVVEGMDRIDANISRMAAQIDELLDVARLQQGHALTLHRRSTDLVQLAREQLAEYQARTARHALRLETAETALTGRWDAARLERVVGNLLSNAIKYSLDGGEVVVRLRRDGTGQDVAAVLEVADHGAGIPAADRARVFTWFYRGENVADRVAGSGIGLAGARQIVELHGGTLTFTSEEGRGSTFTVRLPLQAVEAVQLV